MARKWLVAIAAACVPVVAANALDEVAADRERADGWRIAQMHFSFAADRPAAQGAREP